MSTSPEVTIPGQSKSVTKRKYIKTKTNGNGQALTPPDREKSKTPSRLANFGNKLQQFQPGVCANPGGRPKRDLAAEIARAVFERDSKGLAIAFEQGLRKGNGGMARMFAVLSDRGYGKLTEHLQVDAQVSAGVAERLASARARVDDE